jgi:dihydrolipoamide dehydrogenase
VAGNGKEGTSFDLIVVGGGPGGYVGAIRAAQLGMDVACVEADKLGGVCLNIGCIPTKSLLTSALLVNEMAGAGAHGISFSDLKVDFGPAQERSRKVADQLNRGVTGLFKKNGITHVEGYGRLAGKGVVEVEASDGSKRKLSAKHILLATGSRPRSLPFLEIDGDRIWSSDHALFAKEAPQKLAIVGAGAIGMEFADIFDAYGSEVTIIEALDRVLPLEDADVSKHVEKVYRKRGMTIHTGARLEKTEPGKSGVTLTFKDSKGTDHTIEVDRVLSAVGRVPNTEDLGLDAAGVKLAEKGGFIAVDEWMRTNVEGVYAVGDCAGRQLLAHKASHEGIACVEKIAGEAHHAVDYDNIPNCTYCHPEVASVGLTEEQAKEQGLDIQVGKFPWVGNGRALAHGDAEGFIKVIRDRKYSEIVGAHIVGPHATELIAEFVLGRHLESTVEEMDKAIHPHPTLSEAVAEAALAALGRAIHI